MSLDNSLSRPLPPDCGPFQLRVQFSDSLKRAHLKETDDIVVDLCKTHLRKVLSEDALSSLSPRSMISEAKKRGAPNEVFQELFEAIQDSQRSRSTSVTSQTSPPDTKPPTPIALILDVTGPDHNSALVAGLNTYAQSLIPIICSKRLFSRSPSPNTSAPEHAPDIKLIKQKYDLFGSGDYLVLLPKGYKKSRSLEKRLKSLDLDPEFLKPLSIEQALKPHFSAPSLNGVLDLFSKKNKKHPKSISLMGHGGTSTSVGLNESDLNRFLSFLRHQKCRGLFVTSCLSAGLTSLNYLPSSKRTHRYDRLRSKVTFPVLLHSITDSIVITDSAYRQNFQRLVPEIFSLWNEKGGETSGKLKRLLNSELIEKQYFPQSSLSYLFKSSKHAPLGFRPLGEGKTLFMFTKASSLRLLWERKPLEISGPGHITFSITNIPHSIILNGEFPSFVSSVPGTARHVISEIILLESSPIHSFGEHLMGSHHTLGVKSTKTYFVGSVSTHKEQIESFFIDAQRGLSGYRHNGRCFLNIEGKPPMEVTEGVFCLWAKRVYDKSAPSEPALRAATAGQESISDTDDFFAEHYPLNLLRSDQLTSEEKVLVAQNLMESSEDEALAFLKTHELPPDSKDEMEETLLQKAVKENRAKIVGYLLEKGADPNLGSPIRLAVIQKEEAIMKLLLDHPHHDLRAEHLIYAIKDAKIFKELLEDLTQARQTELFHYGKRDYTLLSLAIEFGSHEVIEVLLEEGVTADFSGESVSPLRQAILRGDPFIIGRLLQAKPDLNQKDSQGITPFEEAFRSAPASLVKELLERASPKGADRLLAEAIRSGDSDKVQLALSLKPELKEPLPFRKEDFDRLILCNRLDLILEVLKLPHPESLERLLVEKLGSEKPEVLIEMLPYVVNKTAFLIQAAGIKKVPTERLIRLVEEAQKLGYKKTDTTRDRYGTPITLEKAIDKKKRKDFYTWLRLI